MTIQYVSGPNAWYEFQFTDDNGNNHWFHLFGDQHTVDPNQKLCSQASTTKTIDILDLIKKIFKDAYQYGIYTDFFLEIPYNISAQTIDDHSYLSKIYLEFKKCFIHTNKKCIYDPYIRMHDTDIRSTFKFHNNVYDDRFITTLNQLIKKSILKLFEKLVKIKTDILVSQNRINNFIKSATFIQLIVENYLLNDLEIYKILITKNNFQDELAKYIDPILLSFDPEIYLESDFNELKKTLNRFYSLYKSRNEDKIFILKHQLDELKKDKIMYKKINIADWIYHFMLEATKMYLRDQIPIFMNAWNKIYSVILKSDLTILDDVNAILSLFKKYQRELNTSLTVIDSTLLDTYILARMFRRYGKIPEQNAVLTIIYEGKNHVDLQKIFFTDVLKINFLHEKVNPQRCLNIDILEKFDITQYSENIPLRKK